MQIVRNIDVKLSSFLTLILLLPMVALPAAGQDVRIEFTNNSPDGGINLTPAWIGFHDGSFDSYNGGLASQSGLERLAEDGNASVISADFLGGLTYIDTSGGSAVSATLASTQPGSQRVDGIVGGAPVAPGQSVVADFTIDATGSNRYFSYVSMVLPSNDYYVANGDPLAHDLMSLVGAPVGTSISFDIGLGNTVNDAGTEINFANISGAGDMEDDTVAGLAILGSTYLGQSSPNTGSDELGVNANVTDPYAAAPSILASHPELNFNDIALYPNGVATFRVTVIPEPSSALSASLLGGAGLVACRRRRQPRR